ncbi:MAG: 2TM domain-containing protein [Acidimicrobiia bacterium]
MFELELGRVPMASEDESDLRVQARKRLQKRRDFTAHVVTYVVVNAMLIGIWAISGAGYFWPAWVLLGWGVGLVLNAWDVFFRRGITEADIDRELERQRQRPTA